MSNITIDQGIACVLRCIALQRELAVRLAREFYADPDRYGTRLPRYIERKALHESRLRRAEVIREELAKLTLEE